MTKSLQAMVKAEALRLIVCAPAPTEFQALIRRADKNWSFVSNRVDDAAESLWPFGRLTPKQIRRIAVAIWHELPPLKH